jgi:hypothetical protein
VCSPSWSAPSTLSISGAANLGLNAASFGAATISGAFANDLGGGHFSLLVANNASQLLLDFTPVLEPSTTP